MIQCLCWLGCGLAYEDLWLNQIIKLDVEDIFELLSSRDREVMFDYIFELRKQSILQKCEEAEEPGPGPGPGG